MGNSKVYLHDAVVENVGLVDLLELQAAVRRRHPAVDEQRARHVLAAHKCIVLAHREQLAVRRKHAPEQALHRGQCLREAVKVHVALHPLPPGVLGGDAREAVPLPRWRRIRFSFAFHAGIRIHPIPALTRIVRTTPDP